MNLRNKIILLVEDDSIIAEAHSTLLSSNGYNIVHANTGERSIELIKSEPVDLVLMDIELGTGIDGAIAAREILQIREIPIIFFTSHTEQEFMQKITDITRYGYIVKNTGHFVLLSSIEMAFKLFELHHKRNVSNDESLLSDKEEKFILALIAGNQGLYDIDLRTGLSKLSPSFAQTSKSDDKVFPESSIDWKQKIHPEDIEIIQEAYQEYLKGIRKDYKVEFRQISEDGSWKWILSQGRIVEWDEKNNPVRMLGTHTDITERKQFELVQKARNTVLDKLIAKQDLKTILREIIRNIESIHPEMRASIVLLNSSGKLETGAAPSLPDFYNEAVNGLQADIGVGACGSAAASGELVIVEDIQTHPYWKDFLNVASRAGLKACWSMPFKDDSGKVLGTFTAYYDKPKIPKEAELNVITEFSRITGLAVQNNNNELNRIKAENEVKSLLIEKEILLKEVHHRIKNNMASVSSLLSLQADYIDDPKVVKILEEAQNRILGMMLIYDKLYKSTDYKNISIKEYLSDLVDQIILSFPDNPRILIQKNIEDFILNSKSLFSIGIIINELITNAFKYAFPENKSGTIIIQVKKMEENRVELIVQDNGIGLPETFSIQNSRGFGLNLIKMLTQKKGNSFNAVQEGGAKFKIVISV